MSAPANASTSKRQFDSDEPNTGKRARFADTVHDGEPDLDLDNGLGAEEDLSSAPKRRDFVNQNDYESDSDKEDYEDEETLPTGKSGSIPLPEGGLKSVNRLGDDEDDDEDAVDEASQDGGSGQEFNEKDDLLSDDDEEQAEMGFKVDRFNMKSDLEDGKFLTDGTFVRNAKDKQEMHDSWLEGTTKGAERAARLAHAKRERERIEKEQVQDEDAKKDKWDHIKELVGLLLNGESVMDGLQRLGKIVKKHKKGLHGKSSKVSSDHTRDEQIYEVASGEVTKITHIASLLINLGYPDVYDDTREKFLRDLRRSNTVPADWKPSGKIPSIEALQIVEDSSAEQTAYEYKFSPAYMSKLPEEQRPTEVKVEGPFSRNQLMEWYNANYFGSNGENILIREQGSGSGWTRWQETTWKGQ